jgi:hypothetical protein
MAWFDVHARELPWRGTRDPYAILVSEVMAQQTQISRVVEAWSRFIGRFPTVAALAAASRAPWTASPGRSSVFDGMHAQYEHSPPTSSRSTMATRKPPSARAAAQCSPGEPPPSTITS